MGFVPHFPSQFKPVYQADCQLPSGTKLIEPPFAVPTCYDWDGNMIANWLVETGFGRYRPIFKKHNISGQDLMRLDATTLRSMGVNDRDDAWGIERNLEAVRRSSRHMEPGELQGLPYNYYRTLYFGEQPLHPFRPQCGEMCYNTSFVPSNPTLRLMYTLSGDKYGWFERNRPHSTI